MDLGKKNKENGECLREEREDRLEGEQVIHKDFLSSPWSFLLCLVCPTPQNPMLMSLWTWKKANQKQQSEKTH